MLAVHLLHLLTTCIHDFIFNTSTTQYTAIPNLFPSGDLLPSPSALHRLHSETRKQSALLFSRASVAGRPSFFF
jgi:hypothetical protein